MGARCALKSGRITKHALSALVPLQRIALEYRWPAVASLNSRTSHSGFEKPSTTTQDINSAERSVPAEGKSVDREEVAKFVAMADKWWDPHGPHRGLHAMNPSRVSFLRSQLCKHFRRDELDPHPLKGLRVIDIGCGGGLLSEPLSRLGADVTGLDAAHKNITIASLHSAKDPCTQGIKYICCPAESLVEQKQTFDAVISLEVVEHVADAPSFVACLGALCRPGGMVAMSTLNRTLTSYIAAVGVAEYVLGWLPRGTHDWSKFVTPEELAVTMSRSGLSVNSCVGLLYDPTRDSWRLGKDFSVNYIMTAVKDSDAL